MKINKEDVTVRVAHLLNVIGTESEDMFKTFNLLEMDCNDISRFYKNSKQGVLLSQMLYMRDTCLTSEPKNKENRWITT